MIVINPIYAELGRNFAATLKPFVTVKPQGTSSTAPFGIMDTSQLLQAKFEQTWLVENVLVKGQPAVLGGSQKTLKTSIGIDLAVSLATKTPFLGRFRVARRQSVLVLSAESGGATLRNTLQRVCTSKGITDHRLLNLHWGFQVPTLSNTAQLKQLGEVVRRYEIDAVLIDPFYLCLTDQKQAAQATNMFSMGPLLAALSQSCLQAGATPIVVHHTRKQSGGKTSYAKFEPPELDDLAFSGIQQFCRQWLLIGRREPYDAEAGKHALWFTYGGSSGHSDAWGLDVVEGRMDGQFGNRSWKVRLRTRSQLAQEEAEAKVAKQADKKRQDFEDAVQEVKQLLRESEQPLTLSDLKNNMKVGKSRLQEVLQRLINQGNVETAKVAKGGGPGTRDYDAYVWCREPSPTSENP